MWKDCDVPINDDEEIDDDWCGWERGTSRYDIWHWFDEQYALWGGVHALMFPDEHKESKFGTVMAEVSLEHWVNDYAIEVDRFEFDCGRALDMLPIELVEKLVSGRADYDTDEVFLEAVRMNLVKDHDGPFDCYICDDDELESYVKTRKRRAVL
jgi:hypothetical protein